MIPRMGHQSLLMHLGGVIDSKPHPSGPMVGQFVLEQVRVEYVTQLPILNQLLQHLFLVIFIQRGDFFIQTEPFRGSSDCTQC